ncbi:multicopper oxidase family protein [Piscinibacter sp.]|uniref:multicopper oxidase family protein n=1 Tax=Piscinibacter sp. TaxID=1903157 RepID=UPI002CF04D31|nr:multicopper oxidase domain-containing protein [Albitalea sp.]HUG25398.1 multicopper oxidase domain-containing protein [Albitalea sp.]
MSTDPVGRRRLVLGSAGAAAAAALGVPVIGGRAIAAAPSSAADVHIELEAVPDQVAVRPGPPTRVWRYRGKLLRGDASVLDASAGGYLGPIIRVRRGQRVRIDLVNRLPESTIIHWHGLHVPDDMDGHPRFAIAPGERYVYDFTVVNRAGSYWFHPHPHGRTGKQVYFGLAGLFLVSDDEEAALGLPGGAHDLPLVIQDRTFDADNQLVYLSESAAAAAENTPRERGMMGGGMMGGMMGGRGGMRMGGMGRMMAGMMGVLGDDILVNGRPSASTEVTARPHRLRLLNACNTRTLKLAWSDGSPLTVIATDGGLLAAPLQREHVMLAPAERIDLWVDFAHWRAGTELSLRSLAFEGGLDMGGMMGGMMGGSALPDGAAFPVMRLRVGSGAAANRAALPARLSDLPPPDTRLAINAGDPKVFKLTMGMMTWGVNGRDFDMMRASELETVKLGTSEVWEFRNDESGMMGMVMPHSMHVHGLQFRVIERTVGGRFKRDHDTVRTGFVDEGWKDTVLVMPGERVRILLRFEDYPGLFLYHCHMLEHEDSGLMRNYLVKA